VVVKQHTRTLKVPPKAKESSWWPRYKAEEEQEKKEKKEEFKISKSDWGRVEPRSYEKPSTIGHAVTPEFKRLKRRDEYIEVDPKVRKKIFYNSKAMLSNLSLPPKLLTEVLDKAENLYKEDYQTEVFYRQGIKDPNTISAMAVYITTLERDIFIPFSKIAEQLKFYPIKDAKRFFGLVLQKYPELYKKLRDPEYRQKRIRGILMALKNQLKLPDDFYSKASEKMIKNFGILKNQRDVVIAGVILQDLIKQYPQRYKEGTGLYDGYNFLGISIGTVNMFIQRDPKFKLKQTKLLLKQPETTEEILDDLWFLF
jgi:hypothetical protein